MLDNKDLQIDTFTNSSKFISMAIVHLPSGIIEKDTGVSSKNLKDALIKRIEERLKS